jgi:hypothetical protein
VIAAHRKIVPHPVRIDAAFDLAHAVSGYSLYMTFHGQGGFPAKH